MEPLFLGVDVGTSGCRAMVIDASDNVYAEAGVALPAPTRDGVGVQQDTSIWWQGIERLFDALNEQTALDRVVSLAVDGTSGSVLLADSGGKALGPCLLYNDARSRTEAHRIAAVAPADTAAHGTTSGLAKILWLLRNTNATGSLRIMHQADWLVGRLCGDVGVTDTNNALKSGYDAMARCWPDWLAPLGVDAAMLPRVVEPGTPIKPLLEPIASQLGLAPHTWVVAGTTDSTAAVIATGVAAVGDAVTSLGSTLVMKVIGTDPVFAAANGVYSQPLGENWLIGCGSNSGGAVLRHFFSDSQLVELSQQIDPDQSSELHYYPLLEPVERFPVNDPHREPRLTPRPGSDARFLQGLLEGMANIEAEAYRALQQLGAPYPRHVVSAGGGAVNRVWQSIRERHLGVAVSRAAHDQAAFGSAQLARRGAHAQGII